MTKEVYSLEDLAERWDVPPNAVYTALRSGSLQGFKIGGKWRVTAEALRDFESRPAIPTAPPAQPPRQFIY